MDEHILVLGTPMQKKRRVPVRVETLHEAAGNSASGGDETDEVMVAMVRRGRITVCRQMVSNNVIRHWRRPATPHASKVHRW